MKKEILLNEKSRNEIDTEDIEFQGTCYSKNRCYINTCLGGGKRREIVVPKWLFYLTWFAWVFIKPHYRKLKKINVLYEEGCSPNEF